MAQPKKGKKIGKEVREKVVAQLTADISNSKSVLFTHYHGLSASQIADLRSKLTTIGAKSSVTKNTLVKIALEDAGSSFTEAETTLKGPTLTIFSLEDAVAAIKTLFDFSKENEALKIRGGIVDGAFVHYEKLEVLSKLPSREQLLAQVVGGMKAPLTGIVGTLGGVQRKFVYALAAIADSKGE